MRREEQVEAAKKIAAANPEWGLSESLSATFLVASGGEYSVLLLAGQVVWLAYRQYGGYLLGKKGGLRRFRSPRAAIYALGFILQPSEAS